MPAPVFTCNGKKDGDEGFQLSDCLSEEGLNAHKPFVDQEWSLTTTKFTIPAEAQKVVVGYVVQGGYVADPNDPTEKYTPDGWTTPLLAAPEATWVNTASVSGAKVTVGEVETTVDANRCSTPVPPGWVAEGNDPEDTRGYPDCKTWHSLKESCFHIRKHGISGADQEVTNELLGSEFLIADTKEYALSGTASRWLCHKNNDPNSGAAYAPPGSALATLGDPDYEFGSDTYAAIVAWNAEPTHSEEQKPLCGDVPTHGGRR